MTWLLHTGILRHELTKKYTAATDDKNMLFGGLTPFHFSRTVFVLVVNLQSRVSDSFFRFD
jgi:hypothetical protein